MTSARRARRARADLGDSSISDLQDLAQALSTSPEQLASYSLIIAVDVDPPHLLPLSDLAWTNQIPFLKVRSVGFFGYLRVQVNETASELAFAAWSLVSGRKG